MEVFYNKFRVAPFEQLLGKPENYFQKVITAGKPLLYKVSNGFTIANLGGTADYNRPLH